MNMLWLALPIVASSVILALVLQGARRRATILGLLSDHGEQYGLDLVKLSGGRLKRGTVYVYLEELVDLGWVSARRGHCDQAVGASRSLYSITPEGRSRLESN